MVKDMVKGRASCRANCRADSKKGGNWAPNPYLLNYQPWENSPDLSIFGLVGSGSFAGQIPYLGFNLGPTLTLISPPTRA